MTDWLRALRVTTAASIVAVGALVVAPWMVIPITCAGLFGAAFAVDRPADDRASRKRVAHRAGLLAWVGVALVWSSVTEHQGTPRLLLAAVLGAGAGVAVLGIVLVGMDARTVMRTPPAR